MTTTMGIYGRFEIAQDNGRGRNTTGTMQVREYIHPGQYAIKAEFPFMIGNELSHCKAYYKARVWIDAVKAEKSDIKS